MATTLVSMSGHQRLVAKLRRLSDQRMVRDVGKALFAAGDAIKVEAQVSITANNKSGAMRKGERKKLYQSSAPGEPPAEDTADLVNSIVALHVAPLVVEVKATDRKAAWLEFGTSRMSERPYLRPAAALLAPQTSKLISDAVDRAIRKVVK